MLAIHFYNVQHVLAAVQSDLTIEDSADVAMSVATAAAATMR